MATILTTLAIEESTYIITAVFTDETDVAVIPNNISWTLTDTQGNVINSRTAVVVAVPASSIDIVLSANDLATSSTNRKRVLTITADYDSDAGTSLPLRAEAIFEIEDLVNIS